MLIRKKKVHILAAFTGLLLLAFGVGCKGFFVNPTLTAIAVGPTATISQGKTVQMSAVGTYDDGSTKPLRNVFWSSSDDNIASVDTSGLVTGASPGQATITGASGTVSGTATITVSLSNVTGITITPSSATAAVNGGTAEFTAKATVSGGNPVDVSDTASWSTSDPNNVTVTQGQTPATVTVGSGATVGEVVTITATYLSGSTNFSATAKLTVTQ